MSGIWDSPASRWQMKQTDNLWIAKEPQIDFITTKMRERLGVESLKISQVADGIILLGELSWQGAVRHVFYAYPIKSMDEELDELLSPLASIGLNTLMVVPFLCLLSSQLLKKYDNKSSVEFVNVDGLLASRTVFPRLPPTGDLPGLPEQRYKASINGKAAILSRTQYEEIRSNPEDFCYLLDFCELDTRGRIRFAHQTSNGKSKDYFVTRDPARLFSLLLRNPHKIIEKTDMDRDLRICDLRSMFFRVRREIEIPTKRGRYRHFHAYDTQTPNPSFMFEPDATTRFVVISVFSSDL